MGFDFNCLNDLNENIFGVNKKDNAYASYFIQVIKFFTAIAMDNTNGLYVNIENINNKLYASVHFKDFTEGYENLNCHISLSDNSFINRMRFAEVVFDVMRYLEDTFQCSYDGKSNKVDTIFQSAISKLSKKKKCLDIVESDDFFEYCGAIPYRNLTNIMYEYNQIIDKDNDANLNISLFCAINNYFADNNYENLNEIKPIEYYNKFFKKLYDILHISSCTKNNYLANYIISGNDIDYWLTNSIANHLLVTKCNYHEILSIGDVVITMTNEQDLARIEFEHYSEPQVINIATNIMFNDKTLEIFESEGLIFKSCNFNKRNGSIDGEMSIIFDLPPFEEVLQEHKDLEEGLVFLY